MSVSWGDHLVFGEGDGKLDTPELLDSAINRWKENLDAGTILWRENRSRQDDYVFVASSEISYSERQKWGVIILVLLIIIFIGIKYGTHLRTSY